jgi:hypothetical protein
LTPHDATIPGNPLTLLRFFRRVLLLQNLVK